ncbi:MAG: hypothetical protein EXS58_14195 [Candidatus Latescibacteria bacterium]|nr:hypothetical protein [Candidatus Latescibacterota bacterium]
MVGYTEIEASLKKMLELIRTKAAGPELLAQVERLDQLSQNLGPETPPMLRHYMEKRGYPKALEFLAGLDERKKPNC